MPSSPKTLREYLVALGFKIDEQQYRDFQNKADRVEKFFKELGVVAAASMTTLSGLLLKVSSGMEDLYFAAQRAGTSVSSLRAVRMAAEQIGLGAENATQNIQAMASALRTNPGLHLFFRQLGIKETGDNVENFLRLIERLRDLSARGAFGHAIATQIASQFGLDEQTLTLYEKNLPALIKAQQEIRAQLAKGPAGSDKQAEQFHQFMVDVRRLEQSVGVLFTTFGFRLLPAAERFVNLLQRAVDYAIQLDKTTSGKSTLIGGGIATVGAGFGASRVLGWLRGLVGGGAGAEAAAGAGAGAAGAGFGTTAGLGLAGILATMGITYGTTKAIDKLKTGGFWSKVLAGILTTTPTGAFGQVMERLGRVRVSSLRSIITGFEGLSLKPYADAGGQSIGYGHRILPGEDFAGGITRERADSLLVQDMTKAVESVKKLVTAHLGANQMAALADFVYNVGGGAFAKSTLLKLVNSGNFQAASDEFLKWDKSRVGGILQTNEDLVRRRLGERQLFLKPDVSMHQSTTIHVTGRDAADAGKAVAAEQQRVNGDLLRNMQGAVK